MENEYEGWFTQCFSAFLATEKCRQRRSKTFKRRHLALKNFRIEAVCRNTNIFTFA